jgi:hypothetical protein
MEVLAYTLNTENLPDIVLSLPQPSIRDHTGRIGALLYTPVEYGVCAIPAAIAGVMAKLRCTL